MKNTNVRMILFVVFIWLMVSACGLLAPQAEDITPDLLYTQAAQTVSAQLTQRAAEAQVTQSPGDTLPTQPAPTSTPAVNTLVPATPTSMLPTSTPTLPLPTFTPAPPTPTPDLRPCDAARFVADLSVPDGTAFTPDAGFRKSWRLENVGICAWTGSYSLVYVSGDRMSGARVVPMPKNVAPGERVDLSVDLVAPDRSGRYTGYWMLANASGQRFGIGTDASGAFWVEIRVLAADSRFAYDLAANMCMASWRSSAGTLTCPGNTGSADGSIALLTYPLLEGDRQENEPTLWTRPETVRNGWISGVYPAYTVKANDHFLAEIGCLENSDECEVIFSLDYQEVGGSTRNLGEWTEVNDGKMRLINIDLTSLAGKSVKLILTVTNRGRPAEADAVWLVPSVRQVAPPDENPAAVKAAVARLASDLGLNQANVLVDSWQTVTWTDTCLGLEEPDEICDIASIPGYRVMLKADGRRFEAHTNQDGSIVIWVEITTES